MCDINKFVTHCVLDMEIALAHSNGVFKNEVLFIWILNRVNHVQYAFLLLLPRRK